jgi:solute carrier family 1 (high affinity glutamate transporter) protein 1
MAETDKFNKLLINILAGIVAGALVGGFFPEAGKALKFIGDLFMRALMLIAVPLIMTSMVASVSALGDIRKLGTLGTRTVIYFVATTVVAVVIGIVLSVSLRPGYATAAGEQAARGQAQSFEVPYRISGRVVTIDGAKLASPPRPGRHYQIELPDQPGLTGKVVAEQRFPAGHLTVVAWKDRTGNQAEPYPSGHGLRVVSLPGSPAELPETSAGKLVEEITYQFVPRNIFEALAKGEVVPVIIAALVFGAVLTTLGDSGKPVIALFQGLYEAFMKMVHLLMGLAPVGIGALIAARLGQAGGFPGFQDELIKLGVYTLTVLSGLAIHGAIVLPVMFVLLCGSEFRLLSFLKGMLPALATAFSTASSSASLPVALDATINNGVSKKVSNFVMPLGTINQNGTALYEAVAAIFLAQVYGVQLGPIELVAISVTATLAAIGAAGIPEAGLVTMALVLKAVHLPLEGISLLLVIDWFLDRLRTAVNVWTDSVGAAILDTLDRGAGQGRPTGKVPVSAGSSNSGR